MTLASMENCPICQESLANAQKTIKGSEGISRASLSRGQPLRIPAEQFVHETGNLPSGLQYQLPNGEINTVSTSVHRQM